MPPMKLGGSKCRPLGATVVFDGTNVVVDWTVEESIVELLVALDVVVVGGAVLVVVVVVVVGVVGVVVLVVVVVVVVVIVEVSGSVILLPVKKESLI